MKRYEVIITREIRCEAAIEVEAVDEVRATLAAKEQADSNNGRDFVEGDIIDENVKVREIGGSK